LEVPRGRGVSKVRLLEVKYEAKTRISLGERGCKTKTFHGGVWIFPVSTHSSFPYGQAALLIICLQERISLLLRSKKLSTPLTISEND